MSKPTTTGGQKDAMLYEIATNKQLDEDMVEAEIKRRFQTQEYPSFTGNFTSSEDEGGSSTSLEDYVLAMFSTGRTCLTGLSWGERTGSPVFQWAWS
ncbi:hypothetical protein SODALDRAFT_374449 [Sodiomyces alkalinus F11]|uniref:Uncharacterized protein n=1 Tax=Sodiomyces alkalinus (strain CBS 110278 / VKM F-3762 / F11) TaxID=1314773 RepID=A0A3N2Q5P9_SODAK|nr:hypothetical protein SODALDRAFT_374449 [Sodiomyces alkalinus F11]ROT42082.1 hypothetical protein SODALDRAFT_374449 [Sodiomyces alkalinus F11]